MQISINKQNATFEEIVREVESQTDFTFMYSTETAKGIGRVSINVSKVTINRLMDIVLTGKAYTYLIEDKVVVLRAKNESPQKQAEKKTEKITGKVLEGDGSPLTGAAILVKGTQIGVVSGEDGTFEIEVPADKKILVFSFISKKTKEVNIIGKKSVEVTLDDDDMAINQVVVTGIFNKSRESYTGSLTTITDKELKASGNRNILLSIRNIDPSFNIADNLEFGSDPNKLPDITIRGRTSMDVNVRNLQEESSIQSNANLPLFIMDGFEVSLQRVMDMDEEMVETITLLKDASATAMYGSRGANGIVVISLKRPAQGKLRVSYRGGINLEVPDFTSYNLMNAREKLEYEKAANLFNSIYNPSNQNLQELYNQRLIEVERGVDTYWLKYPVRTGLGNRHSVRVDGGADNFNYAGTVSYNNILGVMKESSRNTFTGNLFFQYKLKNLKFQNDLTIINNKNYNSPYGDFSEYTTANPIYTPYDSEGNLKKMLVEPLPSSNTPQRVGNPLYNATLPTRDDGSYTSIQNNFAIEWQINKELMFRGNFGIFKQQSRTDRYLSRDHTSFDTGDYTGENFNMRGSYTYATGYQFSYEGSATLNYNKTFNEVHQVYAGLSANIAEEVAETYSVQGRGFSASHMKNLGMAGAYALGKPSSSEQHSRRVGTILNINYTYDRRYFADFSGKIEGSSKFGSNDRTAPFWSAGLGWNMHNETFLSNIPAVNSLRLRLSYGTTGSQNFSSFQALTTYKYFGQENYKFWNGAYMLGLGNPDLSWQKTKHTNFGIEGTLFNGRIRFNADFYNKLTEDLLTDINLPTSGGFPSFKANIGEVRNRGIEIDANAFIIRNSEKRITWSVGGNLAHNVNKILKISNALEFLNSELREDAGPNPSFLYEEGQSMNTIFVVQSLGIDPATGQELFINRLGERVYTWDPQDKVPCGVNEPKIWGNLRTMFRYRNITLNATMSYRVGGYIYNQSLVDKVENISLSRDVNNPWGNLDKRALYERWQEPGDVAGFKNIRDFNATYASSRFVMKENAINLNSVNLNYEFDNEWLKKKLKMDYLSLGFYAEDVFYISTIKQERGLYYPFARKFSLSITARF
ncbi:MAG: SusC/RagA family TonB-linked outer membrane protein [Bacteroidales bacterium]|nr:SusC/RagA family TonB-linked outer membrane protein [Bacteroidales bacterium]MDD3990296.1 SusC/RagA family TonB-linked outer membrane protein [Bacteroidales bacterium]